MTKKLTAEIRAPDIIRANIPEKGCTVTIAVSRHGDIPGREEPEQHPVRAITGLEEILAGQQNSIQEINQSVNSLNSRVEEIADMEKYAMSEDEIYQILGG